MVVVVVVCVCVCVCSEWGRSSADCTKDIDATFNPSYIEVRCEVSLGHCHDTMSAHVRVRASGEGGVPSEGKKMRCARRHLPG